MSTYGQKMILICEKLGIDTSKLQDSLYGTLLDAIYEACGDSGGGNTGGDAPKSYIGTWLINETPNLLPIGTVLPLSYKWYTYTAEDDYWVTSNAINFKSEDGDIGLFYDDDWIYDRYSGWSFADYRTIIVTAEPTNAETKAWLDANAVKQAEPESYIGTWLINENFNGDTLIEAGDYPNYLFFETAFECDGVRYEAMTFHNDYGDEGKSIYYLTPEDYEREDHDGCGSEGVGDWSGEDSVWWDDKYRTITLLEEPSAEFADFLLEHAVKQ